MPKQTNVTAKDAGMYSLALARITLGLILLWAFFDKLLGLGFSTCRDSASGAVSMMCDKAWISGGSPTSGFLKFASEGPLAPMYQAMAGNLFIDVLFMAGLLLIGLALTVGIGMRVAAISGALLMLMMWSAVLPKENHPVLDDHIVYIFVLMALYATNDKQKLGLGKWWKRQALVKRYPVLE